MYIAEIGGHRISAGDTLEIQADEPVRFKILEVLKGSFKVSWLSADKADKIDVIPHSLFAAIGQEITVTEVLDDEKNPNAVFKMRKLYE